MTATERESGRQLITTGTPIRSRPVRLPTRVMPRVGISRRTASTVCAGGRVR